MSITPRIDLQRQLLNYSFDCAHYRSLGFAHIACRQNIRYVSMLLLSLPPLNFEIDLHHLAIDRLHSQR